MSKFELDLASRQSDSSTNKNSMVSVLSDKREKNYLIVIHCYRIVYCNGIYMVEHS